MAGRRRPRGAARRGLLERRWCDDCPVRGAPSAAAPSAAAGGAGELTIFGAASLKGVLDKAKTEYEAANPGTTLTISTDSSSTLETQIEQGAPADVFLSADTTNPQKLVDGGFASGDCGRVRGQQADRDHADRQPGRRVDARRTWRSRA